MESFGKNYKYEDDFNFENDFSEDPYGEIPEYMEYINNVAQKPKKKLGILRKPKKDRDNSSF